MYRLAARLRTHLRQRTLGQSLVEFALILPIFLVFLAATLDLGRVFYANITLNNAAREGAFQAAKTPDNYLEDQPCNQATNRVVCRIQNETSGSMITIQPTDIDVTCSLSGCADAAGSLVTVQVRGQFRLITPLLSFIFGSQNLNLASSATAQIEYLPDATTATPPPGPVAAFTANHTTGTAPLSVTFDPSASTGNPSGYQWDLNGDGTVDSTDAFPTYIYNSPGTYTVSLTVVNLTGVDVELKTNYITVGAATPDPGATPTPTPAITPAPTPGCVYPPNVIGDLPSVAQLKLSLAGFANVTTLYDLSNGPKNKVQAQNPDHTQCLLQTTPIVLHVRPN